jgi:hypothetical protein
LPRDPASTILRLVTDRLRVRRALIATALVLGSLFVTQSAIAQTRKTTTTTTTTEPQTSVSIAPGDTAPNGGPLLVPGDTGSSSSAADTSNSDNTGTVVALVISGLLVVALLLGLLTYWFWRNTRPTKPAPEPATPDEEEEVPVGG